MPGLKGKIEPKRFQFDDSLAPREIDLLVSNSDLRILQCISPVKTETWDLLNKVFFAQRPEVELRVYGFYGSVCDLSFLSRLQNVRHFSADCLMQAVGIEHLATLEKLDSLAIGIYNLEDFDFLAIIPKGITKLSLEATRSKKPRLGLLNRFGALARLYLEGQQKGIEVLSELQTLEDLTLKSITTPNLDFLAGLPRLGSLAIKLGGTTNLSAIEGKNCIKYLELWQIRSLSDINVVSSLYGLQFLFLQSLKNVRKIPNLTGLAHLRRVWLDSMKGLEEVTALQGAPALEEFVHTSAQNMQPAQYEVLLGNPQLKRIFVGFGSDSKNQSFETLMSKAGKEKYNHKQFVFNERK